MEQSRKPNAICQIDSCLAERGFGYLTILLIWVKTLCLKLLKTSEVPCIANNVLVPKSILALSIYDSY